MVERAREPVGGQHAHVVHRVGGRRCAAGQGCGHHQRNWRGPRGQGDGRGSGCPQLPGEPVAGEHHVRQLVEAQELLVKRIRRVVELGVLPAEDAEEDLLIDDQVEVDQPRLGILAQPVEVGALGHRADGADHLAGHLEELEHLEPAVAGGVAEPGRRGRGRGRRIVVSPGVEELVHQVGECVRYHRKRESRRRRVRAGARRWRMLSSRWPEKLEAEYSDRYSSARE